jgi:NACalpha-BTF3-like transcription factor
MTQQNPQETPQEQAQDVGPEQQVEGQEQTPISPQEIQANVQAIMQHYGVDENTALTALAAEHAGLDPQAIIDHIKGQQS